MQWDFKDAELVVNLLWFIFKWHENTFSINPNIYIFLLLGGSDATASGTQK